MKYLKLEKNIQNYKSKTILVPNLKLIITRTTEGLGTSFSAQIVGFEKSFKIILCCTIKIDKL